MNLINIDLSTYVKYDLFKYIQNQNLEFEPTLNAHFKLNYTTQNKSIIFNNLYHSEKGNYLSTLPLVSSFSLEKLEFATLPFYHTLNIAEVNQFGHLNYTTLGMDNIGGYYLNNLYSSNTTHFDLNFKEIKKNLFVTNHIFNNMREYDSWESHAANSVYFNEIMDLGDGKLARFVWEKPTSDVGNLFFKKPLKLQFFNNNKLEEYILPDSTYGVFTWQSFNGKLILLCNHPLNANLNENTLLFHAYTLE